MSKKLRFIIFFAVLITQYSFSQNTLTHKTQNGLTTIKIETAVGNATIYLPEDTNTDKISGTIVSKPKGEKEKQILKNNKLLNSYSIAIGLGSIFFIPNIIKLIRLKRAFFILDPSGIAYRQKWGGVRTYSWKELDLKIYRVQSTLKSFGMSIDLSKSAQFNIMLPNGMALEFKPAEYTHKEYFSVEEITRKLEENPKIPKLYKYTIIAKARKGVLSLIALSFMFYFKLGKLDSKEQIQEAYNEARRDIESRKSQKEPEKKPIFKIAERNLLDENQIYTYLKENVGSAFTAQSLFNRIDELGVNEQIQSKITLNMLEEVLNNLAKKRKINLKQKGSGKFYHY